MLLRGQRLFIFSQVRRVSIDTLPDTWFEIKLLEAYDCYHDY